MPLTWKIESMASGSIDFKIAFERLLDVSMNLGGNGAKDILVVTIVDTDLFYGRTDYGDIAKF